jgi:hypothetical protein
MRFIRRQPAHMKSECSTVPGAQTSVTSRAWPPWVARPGANPVHPVIATCYDAGGAFVFVAGSSGAAIVRIVDACPKCPAWAKEQAMAGAQVIASARGAERRRAASRQAGRPSFDAMRCAMV